jgi:aromatic ring-cleaving dioxygenase
MNGTSSVIHEPSQMSFQYREAARVLKAVENKRGSLKTIIFKGSGDEKKKRKLFAIVGETLRFRTLIEEVLTRANLR